MAKTITLIFIGILVLSIGAVAYSSFSNLFASVRSSPLPVTTTVYAYGPSGLLSKQVGGQIEYYHTDYLSSSSLVTDKDGEVVYRSDYEPFGDSLHVSGEERYTYTGKELDRSTGLYYYGARYYDASLGRFVSVDPVQGSVYSGQRLSRYTYVLDNPMVYTDPSGMEGEFLYGFTDTVSLDIVRYSYTRVGYYHERIMSMPFYDTLDLAATTGIEYHSMIVSDAIDEADDLLDMSPIDALMEGVDETMLDAAFETARMEAISDLILTKVPRSALSEFPSRGSIMIQYGDQFLFASPDAITAVNVGNIAKIKFKLDELNNPHIDTTHAGFKRMMHTARLGNYDRLFKIIPGVGICVGLMCAASEARAGNWGAAGLEVAGAFFDPIDYGAIMVGSLMTPPPQPESWPAFTGPVSAPADALAVGR